MKITKAQLKEMIKEAVKDRLARTDVAEKRIRQLDRFKIESALTYLDILEDVVEQIDDAAWKGILEGLRKKYGYRQ